MTSNALHNNRSSIELLAQLPKFLLHKKKKLQAYKPDSVSREEITIIYLRWLLPTTCICLPWTIGRAALNRSYTWHFSTQGLPEVAVTSNNRGLLPHVFTLTVSIKNKYSGYFLWHFLVSAEAESPAVSGIRCSALSGLSYGTEAPLIVQLAALQR